MTRQHHAFDYTARGCIGAVAGTFLGMLAELFLFWPSDPSQLPSHFILRFESGGRFPVFGPVAGAVLLAVLCARCGQLHLRGLAKHVSIGTLSGVAVGGLFIGAFVYPAVMAERRGMSAMVEKRFATDRLAGIFFGGLIGSAAGAAAGIATFTRTMRQENSSGRTSTDSRRQHESDAFQA